MTHPLAVRAARTVLFRHRRALTLVEMLVAMSITLLMMAAVVTVFANVSGSVNRRRATIEMSGELRNAREILSRDLENATCPTLPPRRPEANEGYLEIIEGPQTDYYPSVWLYDSPDADNGLPEGVGSGPEATRPRIDLTVSTLPGSNLRGASITDPDEEGRGLAIGSNGAADANDELPEAAPTDGRGLGDADDVLMLTVRNENQPFVGRIPNRVNAPGPGFGAAFPTWGSEELESPLAEVVWFAVENPPERDTQQTFAFGEPGYRTIYRRVLLIAPWLDYGIPVGNERTGPGVVRVLNQTVARDEEPQALAALIAFQERYDLSVRLEWDPILGSSTGAAGRWVLRANSLADLTKRENRYEHHGLVVGGVASPLQPSPGQRYPFAAVSAGNGYGSSASVLLVTDPEYPDPTAADFDTVVTNGRVRAFEANPNETDQEILEPNRRYAIRPFAYVNADTPAPATARAYLNEDGSIIRVFRGLVPLSRHVLDDGTADGVVVDRRGEDVVLTDAMAFDLRVYDPGAPLYGLLVDSNGDGNLNDEPADTVVSPGDPAWPFAYREDAIASAPADGIPGISTNYPFRFEGQGAYTDLGYGISSVVPADDATRIANQFARFPLPAWTSNASLNTPLFSSSGWIVSTQLQFLTTEFAVYDTWSWHYENNGRDEDNRDNDNDPSTGADEGANGFDDLGVYTNAAGATVVDTRFGPDDPGERETRPPYEAALRGLEATLRVYERDSLQIREVKVRESFVPE